MRSCITQHHRRPILGRQSLHLLVEQFAQVVLFDRRQRRIGHGHVRRIDAVDNALSLPLYRFAHAQGAAIGHFVHPARHRLAPADGGRLAGQGQKCCLKGVLGVVFIAQQAAAHTEDHALVPPDQQLKRRFIAQPREALQQFGVRQTVGVGVLRTMKMGEEGIQTAAAHRQILQEIALCLYY